MSDSVNKTGSSDYKPLIYNNQIIQHDDTLKNSLFEFPIKKVQDFHQRAKIQTEADKLYDAWSNIIPDVSLEFFEKLTEMSKRLKCPADDLAALMFKESRFDPKADAGKYKGLIQMDNWSLNKSVETCKDTIKLDYHMNMQDFVNLSREEQLPYVEAYLTMMKNANGLEGKKLSGAQLWTLILNPKYIKSKSFLKKVENRLDSIKMLPEKYDTPFYLKRPKN